jgi:hypothetical protein
MHRGQGKQDDSRLLIGLYQPRRQIRQREGDSQAPVESQVNPLYSGSRIRPWGDNAEDRSEAPGSEVY